MLERSRLELCNKSEFMRRFLPIAQLIVGLAVVPQAFLFGALGTLPLVGDLLTGRIGRDVAGPGKLYILGVAVASFSVDASVVLCLVSAVLLIRKVSSFSVRLSIAGAISYWVYIAAHLLMISALRGGLRVEFTLLDAVDYPIGVVAALIAYGLYSYTKAIDIS